jgi:hypothetical protein
MQFGAGDDQFPDEIRIEFCYSTLSFSIRLWLFQPQTSENSFVVKISPEAKHVALAVPCSM